MLGPGPALKESCSLSDCSVLVVAVGGGGGAAAAAAEEEEEEGDPRCEATFEVRL